MDALKSQDDIRMITYPLKIEDEDTWNEWKKGVPRTYPSVGDRLIEFIERDLQSREETGKGLLERFDEYESNR
ncbi:hypothetical protein [Haladaptatus halobius]|uniref:hypothetical protein n=1 Tax=Haladaptatus halobius TaxID=2884875 RepID=UPI001D0AD873|nr:hypothetical protein [Haladaptatus halobius]